MNNPGIAEALRKISQGIQALAEAIERGTNSDSASATNGGDEPPQGIFKPYPLLYTDPRDGRVYKTVQIGKQIWMAENLAYNAPGSKCYDNNIANGEKYGRLYDWQTAMNACPKGWHLPSNEEWETLVNFAGGKMVAGNNLKAADGWDKDGNGTDNYGFAALPGGNGYSVGYFNDVGDGGYWWSSTENDAYRAYGRYMSYYDEDVGRYDSVKDGLFSVRCLQDKDGLFSVRCLQDKEGAE